MSNREQVPIIFTETDPDPQRTYFDHPPQQDASLSPEVNLNLRVHEVSQPRKLSVKAVAIITGAAVLAGVAWEGFNRFRSGIEDFTPKAEDEFDITDFREAMSNESTVATGEIESEATVTASRRYLFADAECEGTITGSQGFVMKPEEDGSNITLEEDEVTGKKRIIVKLDDNEIEVKDQHVVLPDFADSCEADWIGGHFGDESKVFGNIAEQAPEQFSGETKIESAAELEALESGQVGLDLAEAAASTYQDIGGTMLELAEQDIDIVYMYRSDKIEPDSSNQLTLERRADGIDIET